MTQRQVFSPLRLDAQALSLGRGDTILARNLSFSVGAGSGLLLRGPNGAGKSTLLLTLAGVLEPVEGEIAISGHADDAGPAVHYCGHRNAVRPRIGVLDTLQFWADINGATGMAPKEALDRVGLGRLARVDAGYLSAGQSRRLALARLLVSIRPIWLLDEPTAALDAEGQGLLAQLLTDHLGAGGLAIIATHDAIDVPGLSVLTIGSKP